MVPLMRVMKNTGCKGAFLRQVGKASLLLQIHMHKSATPQSDPVAWSLGDRNRFNPLVQVCCPACAPSRGEASMRVQRIDISENQRTHHKVRWL